MESYFEYCLRQCDDCDIATVSEIYKNKEQILNDAKKGFNGNDNILGQVHLIRAASSFLEDNGFVCYDNLGRDTRKLYDRFKKRIEAMKKTNSDCKDVDRESMFNTLVDLNWLIPSLYKPFVKNDDQKIELLSSQSECKYWLNRALMKAIYEEAVRYKEYSEHFKEAQSFKYTIFTGTIPFREVNDYIAYAGYSISGLQEEEKYFQSESVDYMALFYGLTVTAALAKKIRRVK